MTTEASAVSNKVRQFYQPSSVKSVLVLSLEVTLVASLIYFGQSFAPAWAYPLLVIALGTRQYVLGEVLTHDSSHHNLSRKKWLNNLLGYISAWSVFHTVDAYWAYHKQHHEISVTVPENNIFELYGLWQLPPPGTPMTRLEAFWHLVLKPASGYFALRYYVYGLLRRRYMERHSLENNVMVGFWIVALVGMGFAGVLGLFVKWWLVPYFFVYALMMFWSEVGEHYRTGGAGSRTHTSFWRNTFIAYGSGYHALHHKYPGIPCFRLHEAYPHFKEELQTDEQVSSGYVTTFHQIVSG